MAVVVATRSANRTLCSDCECSGFEWALVVCSSSADRTSLTSAAALVLPTLESFVPVFNVIYLNSFNNYSQVYKL